jgi:vancomycin permeability regulator SanA
MLLLRHPLVGGILVLLLVGAVELLGVAWQIVSYGNLPAGDDADAAIVLGAAAWGNKPSPVYRERINEAIALYKAGRVRYLVFTGGTPAPGYPAEGEVGRKFAIEHGVPAAAPFCSKPPRARPGKTSRTRDSYWHLSESTRCC